jgi:hypothetical protein
VVPAHSSLGVAHLERGTERPLSGHESLAAALVAALADLTVVETGRTAEIPTKTGGKYSYKYADIADVVRLTRPVLAAHGLTALTPVHDHGDLLACTVILLHSSGEKLELGPFPFPPGRDAQATGSAITYHRRYALVAALGMAAGDDDDGHAATQAARQPARAPEKPADALWAKDAKATLLEAADGDVKAATAAWNAAGLDGKHWCSEAELAAAMDSLPFDDASDAELHADAVVAESLDLGADQ